MAKTKVPGYQDGRQASSAPSKVWIGVLAAVVLVVIGVIAILGASESNSDAVEVADLARYGGEALPGFTSPADDPAVGSKLPSLTGVDVDGNEVTVTADDAPMMVVAVAHWCPHCQDEVPELVELVDSGQWPEDVALVFVSTAQDRPSGNWPPSQWLEREGVTSPVVVDDADGTLARALGVSGFPFSVAVASDGVVAWRFAGAAGGDQILEMARALAAGETGSVVDVDDAPASPAPTPTAGE